MVVHMCKTQYQTKNATANQKTQPTQHSALRHTAEKPHGKSEDILNKGKDVRYFLLRRYYITNIRSVRLFLHAFAHFKLKIVLFSDGRK